jgi:hypothetical protein
VSVLYAVVDAARDERIYDLVHDALFPMCLYRTDVVSPLGRAAPYLMPVEHAEKLMEAWRRDGLGQSWGIFLRAGGEQARVLQRLRTFNQAQLPDGRVVVFRWWDPRVFRVYLPTCNADDLTLWFAAVDEYICENADGEGFAIYRNSRGKLARESAEGLPGLELRNRGRSGPKEGAVCK